MKISKSKQELARIISENGGWRNGEFAAQDSDGSVGGYEVKPEWDSLAKYWWREACGQWFLANKIKNHHQTVLSRAEYFHLYPAPDADGWTEWKGGECPVKRGTLVDVKYANGITNIGVSALTDKTHADHTFGTAGSLLATNWSPGLPMSDIIAYRLHKTERENPECCETVMSALIGVDMASGSDSTALFTINAKPTIEQLAADYRTAKDCAERKQQEADDAKADADEALRKLELAGEEIGIIVTPITAKQEPEPVIADWRDLQTGDIIEYVDGRNKDRVGMVGRIDGFDRYNADTDRPVRMVSDNGQVGWPTKWRFIRRP